MNYGPCMCGGCKSCLHAQGYNCDDPLCPSCTEDRQLQQMERDLHDPQEEWDNLHEWPEEHGGES